MVHVSQKIRMQNLQTVKTLIAKAMPQGAKNKYLIAVLCTTYGFHRRTAKEYLTDLLDAGQIVWDSEGQVWKLPIEEGENQK